MRRDDEKWIIINLAASTVSFSGMEKTDMHILFSCTFLLPNNKQIFWTAHEVNWETCNNLQFNIGVKQQIKRLNHGGSNAVKQFNGNILHPLSRV